MLKVRLIFLLTCLGLASIAGATYRLSDIETRSALTYQLHPNQSHPNQTAPAPMSLEQAVAMVQARYGARALRFNTVEEDGRVVHYIRLISADRSRVWTVRVDAATGQEF